MNEFAPPSTIAQITTDDGTVLLDEHHGRMYGFNPTGSAIWHALTEGCSVEQISHTLAARFAASPKRICADVTAFIAQLHERGLLTRKA